MKNKTITFFDLAQSDKFKEFFSIVYNMTGMLMVLVDPSGKQRIRLFTASDQNPLCKLIQSNSVGKAACHKAIPANSDQISKSCNTRYICHAGLIDFAVPIFIEGKHIATFLGGQILTAPASKKGFADLQKRLNSLGLDPELLRDAYFQSLYLPEEKIQSIIQLIRFFAEYFYEIGQRLRQLDESGIPQEIINAKEYLDDHFHEPISLSCIAEQVNLSPAYFSHLFKKHLGTGFIDYLQSLRIDEAKKLLQKTKRPIINIAFDAGFGSLPQFNRVFKAMNSCSPGEYRNS
jgi:AraC-like DNA-binding protein